MDLTLRRVRLPYKEVLRTDLWQRQKRQRVRRQRILLVWLVLLILTPLVHQSNVEAEFYEATLLADGQLYSLHTTEHRVAAILEELGIELEPGDLCRPMPTEDLKEGQRIEIDRAVPVKLSIYGSSFSFRSPAKDVAALLEEQHLVMAETDRIDPSLETPLEPGMEIELVRVQRYTFSIQHPMPYAIIREESSALGKGYEQQVQWGQEGVREETVEVLVENGVDVGWTLLSDEVLAPAVNAVVQVGTAGVATYDEVSFPFSKMMIIETTGYCPCYICCGKNPGDRGYGITKSGLPAGRGVVGADPNFLPQGTRLYVEGYGYCVVGDTGSALVGRMRVDLGFATHQEAYDWALRRETKVYILDE